MLASVDRDAAAFPPFGGLQFARVREPHFGRGFVARGVRDLDAGPA